MCFFRDLWSFISKSSHCFILPNGFSNLLWLNLIVALRVNSKWAYTGFILCVQLVKEQQPAILPVILQKSYLTPKNIEGAFAMKFLKSLGLDAQWGHTVKRTLSTRNFLFSLQTFVDVTTFVLPERWLPHAGKGVFVVWCKSLPYCWRAAVAACGVSRLNWFAVHTEVREMLWDSGGHTLWPSVIFTNHMFCSPVIEEVAKPHSTHHQTRTVFTSAGKQNWHPNPHLVRLFGWFQASLSLVLLHSCKRFSNGVKHKKIPKPTKQKTKPVESFLLFPQTNLGIFEFWGCTRCFENGTEIYARVRITGNMYIQKTSY